MRQAFSSPSLLAGAGVFTSPWIDTDQGIGQRFNFVSISVYTDQLSASLGLVIQEADDITSPNAANVIFNVTSVSVPVTTGTSLFGVIRKQYWRVVYTNGATFQTIFNLFANASTEVLIPVAADGTQPISFPATLPLPTAPSTYTEITQVTKANIKASAGNVVSIYISNINATLRYFQLHNKATPPAGGDVPVLSLPVGGGTPAFPIFFALGTDFFTDKGMSFAAGIGWAISTTYGTFTDSATASDHIAIVNYR
jgi:hypothetical protein